MRVVVPARPWGLGTEEEEGYRTGLPGYIGWRNSFLGIDSGAPYTFKNTGSEAKQPGGIGSLESILGLLKSLKIRALAGRYDNPIPTRFLAPIDCLKIPAQHSGSVCTSMCILRIQYSYFDEHFKQFREAKALSYLFEFLL